MNTKWKQRLSLTYEIVLVVLAFISVIFIWSENETIRLLDRFVWAIFFVDVVVRLVLANKCKYVKTNPFDIIAAIPLDSIFQTARIVRLFRLLRLIAISKNYLGPVFKILKTNGLDKVLVISFLLIFAAGTVITFIAPSIHNFADGVWWAIVTTTTVGYGDISPTTIVGRLLAILLMLVGVGLIGMLTSSITTFFVKEGKEDNQTVRFIKKQLER